jgi:hypothetical protein
MTTLGPIRRLARAPLQTSLVLTWALVGLGIGLRVAEYGRDREAYRDEKSLLLSIRNIPLFQFNAPLAEYQVAPPGFLVAERVVGRWLGSSLGTLRLVPLAFGIAALILFPAVARHYVEPRAALLATALFAVSDQAIYYASELKPYASDVALTLAAFLFADRPTPRRLVVLGLLGVVATWFSFPSAFVLAAIGPTLILRSWWLGTKRLALMSLAMSLIWALSFAASYHVAESVTNRDPFLRTWWHFAFIPIPPRTLADCERIGWQVANVLINPVGLSTPLGSIGTALLGLGLSLIGAIALGSRRPDRLAILTLPALAVLAASGLRAYPFHGRLLLFLVPSALLIVSEGSAVLTRRTWRPLLIPLAAFLLLRPTFDLTSHFLINPIIREFDSHGDLRPDLLDRFEARGAPSTPPVGR